MHREEEGDNENFVGDAEKDFWTLLAQERKDIEAKEEKRRELLMPKQPTPIPELEEEAVPIQNAEEDAKSNNEGAVES